MTAHVEWSHLLPQLAQAAIEMRSAVLAHQPGALSNRFLLEKMQAAPLAELIVSIRRDARFGMAMTIGWGGVLVELVEDAVTLLLSASREGILSAMMVLKATLNEL